MKTKCFCLVLVSMLFSSTLSARHQPTFSLIFSFATMAALLYRDSSPIPGGVQLKQNFQRVNHPAMHGNEWVGKKRVPSLYGDHSSLCDGLYSGYLFSDYCRPQRVAITVMPLSGKTPVSRCQVVNPRITLRVPPKETKERAELVGQLMAQAENGYTKCYWEKAAIKLGLSEAQIDSFRCIGNPAERLLQYFENKYPHGAAQILHCCFLSINSRLSDLLEEVVLPGAEEVSGQGEVGSCDMAAGSGTQIEPISIGSDFPPGSLTECVLLRAEVALRGEAGFDDRAVGTGIGIEPLLISTEQLAQAFPFFASPDYEEIVMLIISSSGSGHDWQALARFAGMSDKNIADLEMEGTSPCQVVDTILRFLLATEPDPGRAFDDFKCALYHLDSSEAVTLVMRWGRPEKLIFGDWMD
ncbi:hypothetical protein NX722_14930 [Endozoicomonas gorgoniicola]|uniref:Uncharacterized protein n=1 Tax=Endozoicomonas gorgoniicola TaxID=1234144 RepID=A0ABT3MWY4_9GAMM|nr:hypothetical protein [Endozoicomonas gorgoniicola]MCW7553895.1 hypothetical protein [Endozoicomonas gorgoniicola]